MILTTHAVGLYQATEGHVATYDRNWQPGGRLALFAHGRGGTYLDAMTAGQGLEVVRALAGQGYLVLACEFGGAVWGNDTAKARIATAIAYAATTWGAATAKVTLLGASMGALDVLNWAKDNVGQVARIALCVPVVDLVDFKGQNRGGFAAEIQAAYGGAGPYAAAEAGHDPMQFASALAALPVKSWYATDDPLVPQARVDAFATAASAAKKSLGAVGHTVSWDPEEVRAFVQ